MIFAPLIRTARWQAGLTQSDLAAFVGIGERAVWQIEQGSGTLKSLLPILGVLHIPVIGLPPAANIGSRIRAARLKHGWSLRELSRRSKLSLPTVRPIEEQSAGRVTSLEALIRALAPRPHYRRRFKARLAEPRTQSNPSSITSFIHGDCMEVMPTLGAGSVDLAVTSPPYNADKEYEDCLSLEQYTNFAERWLSCVSRVLSNTGALWLNLGYMKTSATTTLPLTYLYFPLAQKLGLHLIQEIVWHYEGGLSYTSRFAHRTERWMWFVKDPTNYVFHLDEVRDGTLNRTTDLRNHEAGKNPSDYWYYDRVVGGRGRSSEKTVHPAQFPVAMAERIIRACSNPGDVVLDCFGGSGSTAEAAGRNGRSFISIERDAQYDAVARERLARVTGKQVAAE